MNRNEKADSPILAGGRRKEQGTLAKCMEGCQLTGRIPAKLPRGHRLSPAASALSPLVCGETIQVFQEGSRGIDR